MIRIWRRDPVMIVFLPSELIVCSPAFVDLNLDDQNAIRE